MTEPKRLFLLFCLKFCLKGQGCNCSDAYNLMPCHSGTTSISCLIPFMCTAGSSVPYVTFHSYRTGPTTTQILLNLKVRNTPPVSDVALSVFEAPCSSPVQIYCNIGISVPGSFLSPVINVQPNTLYFILLEYWTWAPTPELDYDLCVEIPPLSVDLDSIVQFKPSSCSSELFLPTKWWVMDLLGRVKAELNTDPTVAPDCLSELPPGAYILRSQDDQGNIRTRRMFLSGHNR